MTRIAALAAALSLLLACGPSPDEKIELARRSVQSWTATVEKTIDALEHGAVPRVYGRQILSAARESRSQAADTPEWQTISADQRGALDQAIQRLDALVGDAARGGGR